MMWLFNIKTDGTHKARLVGRGDLMKAYVDFDPDSCSIKMCVAIAAKYKLEIRGGDIVGAYLVTELSKGYRVFLKCPEGYTIPDGIFMDFLLLAKTSLLNLTNVLWNVDSRTLHGI